MNDAVSYFQDESRQTWLALTVMTFVALPWIVSPLPELPLIIVAGVAALIAGINHPTLVLAIFLGLSLLRVHEAYPAIVAFRLPLVFSAMTFAAAAWHVFVTHSLRPFWPSELRLLLVFFAIVTISSAFAESTSVAWAYWTLVFWKIALMTLLIAWIPQRPRDFELLARTFVIAGIAVAAAAIYNKYSGVGLVSLTRVTLARDINGNLGDPNELALVLLIPLSFALASATHRSGTFNRMLGVIAAVTILVAIVFTESRGGLLGTLAVIGVFGLRLRSRMVLALLSIVVALGLYQAMGLSERVAVYGGISMDESILDRLSAWKGALAMAFDRPLTGVGLANFADSLPNYQPGLSMVAHSTWLGVLAETGVPGLVAFVVLVVATIRTALRSRRALHLRPDGDVIRPFSTGLVAALAGFCVAGSFLTHGFTWPFYTLVGLSVALSRYVAAPAPAVVTINRTITAAVRTPARVRGI
jgi:probable O-glycosylation ligase (exosortase A-associated)